MEPGDTPHDILDYARQMARHDTEMGVSLLVGGTWITGMLTSGRRYMDALIASIREGTPQGPNEGGTVIADALEEQVNQAILEGPLDDDAPLSEAVFLRKARTLLGVMWSDPAAMSVRADQVGAFVLGNFVSLDPE